MPVLRLAARTILFVHIPKTGGSSVEQWMGSLGPLEFIADRIPEPLRCTPQHLRAIDVEGILGRRADYAFAIVRNPFDRLESEYRWRLGLMPGIPPFEAWAERSIGRTRADPWDMDNHLRPQSDFPSPGCRIFRFEEGLPAILAKVAAEIGVAPSPAAPHLKDSSAQRDAIRWTPQLEAAVRDLYAADFETFGYATERADRPGQS